MIKLRRFLKDYKKECIIGPLCKLFEAILELIVPLVMADIIDNGVTNGDKGYVLRMGLVMVALAATGLLSALVCQYFASKASQGFGTKVRRALFSHINSLSHAELDKLGTPSLITSAIISPVCILPASTLIPPNQIIAIIATSVTT